MPTESEGSDHERDWEEQQIRKGTNMPQVKQIVTIIHGKNEVRFEKHPKVAELKLQT